MPDCVISGHRFSGPSSRWNTPCLVAALSNWLAPLPLEVERVDQEENGQGVDGRLDNIGNLAVRLVVHPGVDGVRRLRVVEVEVGHLRTVELPAALHEIRQKWDAQPGPKRVRRLERHLGIGARQRRPERGMRPVDLIQAEAFQASASAIACAVSPAAPL